MTVTSPDNTPRYYVDYVCLATNHTAIVRAAAPLSPSAFGALYGTFLTASGNLFFSSQVTLVRWSAAGSNVTNPVTTGIEGTTYGTGTGTADSVPVSLNFIGRSSGGKRVRIEIFSYSGPFSTFRLTGVESPAVQNMVNTMNGSSNGFLSIDGLKPLWYSYANVSVNAYWQRAKRA